MNSFKKLLSPISVNNLQIHNRMVVSAMVTNFANEDGTITERFKAYYEEKAKGGWGLIIVEDFPVNSTGGKFRYLPKLFTQQQIEQYSDFTNAIHKHGSKVFAQIYHAGSKTSSKLTGTTPVAPSSVCKPGKSEVSHELTISEIYSIIDDFSACALAAEAAGFDGIEIHGGHGYLINQFISKCTNKRFDEYGGPLRNRLRFPLEIVEKIRRSVSPGFVICYRMTSVEYCEGGTTLEESKAMAMMLEHAGVDMLNITQGSDQSYVIIPPSCVAPASYVDNARQIREVVHIPVITAGRINDPYIAESVLTSNAADLVVMARASIADPLLPKKLMENHVDDIQYCIGCLQGCTGQNRIGRSVRCMVNPLTGRESEYDLTPAAIRKKVLVVGGGVSGCSAAIAASMKGHHVTLMEKSECLGGQWLAASMPPGKQDFLSFIAWQQNALQKSGVKLLLNTTANPQIIEREAPDVVILATGSKPLLPPIPGIQSISFIYASELLYKKTSPEKNAVIIGGGLVGAETALYLAEKGCQVTIIERLPSIAPDGEPNCNHYLMKSLYENHVSIYTSTNINQIDKAGIYFEHSGKSHFLKLPEEVVIATGVRSYEPFSEQLQSLSYDIYTTGDAKKVKNGFYNIQESFELGLSI